MAERNDKGQFVKGYGGGPGRPKREVELDYLNATIDAVSLTDWRDIVVRAVNDAKAGKWQAREWLANYLLGKPVQKQQITGADDGALETKSTVTLDLTNASVDQLIDLLDRIGDS